jgi:hypothetical protein
MKLKHGALYVGGNRVAEMTVDGLKYTNIFDFLFSKDVVVAVNPSFQMDKDHALEYLTIHEQDEYDWQFSEGNPDTYCFELVAKTLEACSSPPVEIKTVEKSGVSVYAPESFLNDTENFEIVFLSNEAIRKEVLR